MPRLEVAVKVSCKMASGSSHDIDETAIDIFISKVII